MTQEDYLKGKRIRLLKMYDDPHPIPPGTLGTITEVVRHTAGGDWQQIWVKWETKRRRSLALSVPPDEFEIVLELPTRIVRNETVYMHELGDWIYIAERERKASKTWQWSRMPTVVTDRATGGDVPVAARTVPRQIRRAAVAHFGGQSDAAPL